MKQDGKNLRSKGGNVLIAIGQDFMDHIDAQVKMSADIDQTTLRDEPAHLCMCCSNWDVRQWGKTPDRIPRNGRCNKLVVMGCRLKTRATFGCTKWTMDGFFKEGPGKTWDDHTKENK